MSTVNVTLASDKRTFLLKKTTKRLIKPHLNKTLKNKGKHCILFAVSYRMLDVMPLCFH